MDTWFYTGMFVFGIMGIAFIITVAYKASADLRKPQTKSAKEIIGYYKEPLQRKTPEQIIADYLMSYYVPQVYYGDNASQQMNDRAMRHTKYIIQALEQAGYKIK